MDLTSLFLEQRREELVIEEEEKTERLLRLRKPRRLINKTLAELSSSEASKWHEISASELVIRSN